MQTNIIRRLGLVLVSVMPLAACDVFGVGGDESVSLSFAVPGSGARAQAALLADTISDGAHKIDLTSLDLTVDEIVLERAESEVGGDSDGESDEDSDSDGPSNEKFRSGSVTIALPVNGGVVTPLSENVPAGLYEKVELDVDFVRLRGTYDGQAFDVTVAVKRELELNFNPPLDVKDKLNITIKIDALAWLRGADGKLIDPRQLSTNSTLRSAFVKRVEASFKAFEDSDKDADDSDSDSDSDRSRR